MNENRLYTEQEEKQRAYEAQCQTGSIGAQTPYGETMEPKRESMSARFRSQANRLRKDQRKLDRLGELNFLLEKNPDIARILDLVDELGHDNY